MKSHVRVFVRTRPSVEPCEGIRTLDDGKSLNVSLQRATNTGVSHGTQEALSFKFDGILEGSGQDSVYANCAHEVAEGLLSGYNGTVFCYGQTGAGKTYTMSGEGQQYSRRGVTPRALHHIFEQIDIRVDRQMTVRVSFVEVYNEVLFDLLSPSPGTPDDLTIVEEGGVTGVRGLTQVQVSNEAEALALLFEGEANRSTAAHALNAESSRSHSIFTLHLSMRMAGEGEERAVASKLNLVDLAGSERTKKTGVTGQALKEANAINKSLTFLEQTVNALSRKEGHIPFRQSKLTHLLKDALGGNCKTVMVANIWPHASHMEETLSTLRFASRVRLIETAARISESYDPSLMLKRYERQIKELKAELAMRDTLTGRGQVNYNDLTDAEVADLRALVRQFLEGGGGGLDQLPCDTLKQVKETYKQMHLAYQAVKQAATQLVPEIPAKGIAEGQRPASPTRGADQGGLASSRAPEGVGEEDPQAMSGFYVGLAPANLRPPKGTDAGPAGSTLSPRSPLQAPDSHGGLSGAGLPDKNAAFISYKRDVPEGRSLDQAARASQAEHKMAKQQVKECGLAVNTAKRNIDEAAAASEAKKAEAAASSADVLDSEEHQLLQTLKAAKLKFRSDFNQLKVLQSSLPGLAQAEAAACTSLIDGFNSWFSANYGGAAATASTGFMGASEAQDDEADVFERMQQAQLANVDPDSSAFFAARKQVRRKQAAQTQRNFQRTVRVM